MSVTAGSPIPERLSTAASPRAAPQAHSRPFSGWNARPARPDRIPRLRCRCSSAATSGCLTASERAGSARSESPHAASAHTPRSHCHAHGRAPPTATEAGKRRSNIHYRAFQRRPLDRRHRFKSQASFTAGGGAIRSQDPGRLLWLSGVSLPWGFSNNGSVAVDDCQHHDRTCSGAHGDAAVSPGESQHRDSQGGAALLE